LGQSLEFPFEEPSSPHEEFLATSLEPEVHLDVVIERIEKLRLDENLHHLRTQLDHLRKVLQNDSQKHLKVFILMRSKRQEPKCPQDKMEVI
jgi:hypothetical protein